MVHSPVSASEGKMKTGVNVPSLSVVVFAICYLESGLVIFSTTDLFGSPFPVTQTISPGV